MRVALLTMNPWSAPDHSHRPFSLAVYRLQATLIAAGLDVEVRLFDANDWTIEQWVDALEAYDPHLIGPSAYLWSLPTFLEVCGRLKRNDPRRWVVLGGPSARVPMLELEPWQVAGRALDAVCTAEGESVLPEAVKAWPSREALHQVPGIAWFDDGWTQTAPAERLPMDALASPYRMGLVPHGTLGQIETYRGCPMSCDFCQWGVLSPSREVLSKEALIEEFKALKALGSPGLLSVDVALNLHPRAFRELLAAEREVGFIADTELACEVYPSKLTEEHLELLASTRSTVGIGLQSMDAEMLKGRGRPFQLGRFEAVVERLAKVAKTNVEIIVGLPGTSPELFWKTLDYVRTLPVSVRVFEYLVLPDAGLRHVERNKVVFDPYTLRMASCDTWPEPVWRDTLDRVHDLSIDNGGWLSHNWPLPAERDTPTAPLGRPLAGPMWIFPNAEHEADHRFASPGEAPLVERAFPPRFEARPGSDLVEGELDRVHSGDLGGVVVHKLLSPALCSQLVRRLQVLPVERHPLGDRFAGETLGLGLDHASADLRDYFAQNRRTLPQLTRLFGKLPLQDLFLQVFQRLSKRPVALAQINGQDATPFTVRHLPDTGCIPPHIELEQTMRPPYARLAPKLDGDTVMSFLLMLQPANEGGRLRLHDLQWNELGDEDWVRGRTRLQPLLTGRRHHDVELNAGDLLVFDGGRWCHEVTPVEGGGERWTAGGFLAGSADGEQFWMWC